MYKNLTSGNNIIENYVEGSELGIMFNRANSEIFSPKTTDINKIIDLLEKEIKKLYNLGFVWEMDRNIEITNGRFKEGLKCPRCGDSHLNKNGITNGRQRYICKNCKRTFDERTLSPLSNTKLSLEKWIKYCKFMVQGGSIRECAKEVSVSVPTSFFMRHRILDVMNLYLKDEILEGVVETELCYLNESFKGARISEYYFSTFDKRKAENHHFVYNRIPSIENSMKNVKQNQICINTAIDRKGNILTRIVDNNFPIIHKREPKNIVSFFEVKVKPNVILCTHRLQDYMKVARNLNLKMVKVSMGSKKRIYSIRNVSTYNRKLRKWIKNFNGVATKYLNNYLSWFKFLYQSDKFKTLGRVKDIFMKFATEDLYVTKDMIKNRYVELI